MRLNITVYQIIFVRVGQCLGNFLCNLQGFGNRQMAFSRYLILKSLAIDIFHNDIVHSVLYTDIVDVDYVRMGKARRALCLHLEFCQEFFISCKLCMQNFYSNHAVKNFIVCFIHICHTATADAFKNLISIVQNAL